MVAVTVTANLAADPGVAASAHSLTHLEVRSLACSAAPWARLAGFADSLFGRDGIPAWS